MLAEGSYFHRPIDPTENLPVCGRKLILLRSKYVRFGNQDHGFGREQASLNQLPGT